jgi:hypothetical protein
MTINQLNTELKAKAAAAGLSTYVANAILSNEVTEAMLDNAAIAYLERWYWDAHEAIVQSEERVVAAQKAIDAYLASGASLF